MKDKELEELARQFITVEQCNLAEQIEKLQALPFINTEKELEKEMKQSFDKALEEVGKGLNILRKLVLQAIEELEDNEETRAEAEAVKELLRLLINANNEHMNDASLCIN